MATDTAPEMARATGRALLSLVRSLIAFAGRRGAFAALYVALGAIFESVGLILLIPLLGIVIGGGAGQGTLAGATAHAFRALSITTTVGRLSLLMTAFAVLMVIRGIVIALRDTTVVTLQVEYVEHLRAQIAGVLASAGWDNVLRLRHARIMNIMSADIQRVAVAANYLLMTSIAVVILVAQTALSFVLSPGLALLSFALLIASGLALIPMMRRARALGRYVGVANLSLVDTVSQFLSGLKLALSQNLQGSFALEFRDTLQALTARQLTYYRQQVIARVALMTISALVGAVVFLVGYVVFNLPGAILIPFLFVIVRMSGPATQIMQGFQQLAHGLPAYETTAELILELRTTATPPAATKRDISMGAIVLDTVSFQHPHVDGSVSHGVRGVSLRIAPGMFIGIAGNSGAGKTTLADLIVGLLRPQAGRILAGGTPLEEATLASWRAQISYVSQDPFLFHDTVRRNLRWARPEASESDMQQALALAGADEIVRRMDGGLDAVVGERGTLVSGGERQRIALARALLRQPKLLIMDEATNAIDVDGERALLGRLRAIQPPITIVMIAHRTESLALCDQILCMEDGKLLADASREYQPAG